uniref:Uncharacterized protein n=1 Tax=Caenorhabditis japonica TaxID=281687 RepID=A0A8R1EJ83_CAEJA
MWGALILMLRLQEYFFQTFQAHFKSVVNINLDYVVLGRQLAESSPYYEVIKSKNKEVLFLYDPADEVVFLGLGQFDMKQLVPVEKWAQEEAEK